MRSTSRSAAVRRASSLTAVEAVASTREAALARGPSSATDGDSVRSAGSDTPTAYRPGADRSLDQLPRSAPIAAATVIRDAALPGIVVAVRDVPEVDERGPGLAGRRPTPSRAAGPRRRRRSTDRCAGGRPSLPRPAGPRRAWSARPGTPESRCPAAGRRSPTTPWPPWRADRAPAGSWPSSALFTVPSSVARFTYTPPGAMCSLNTSCGQLSGRSAAVGVERLDPTHGHVDDRREGIRDRRRLRGCVRRAGAAPGGHARAAAAMASATRAAGTRRRCRSGPTDGLPRREPGRADRRQRACHQRQQGRADDAADHHRTRAV